MYGKIQIYFATVSSVRASRIKV